MNRRLVFGLQMTVGMGCFLSLLLFDRSAFQTFREPKVLATLWIVGSVLCGWSIVLATQALRGRALSLPPLPILALLPVFALVVHRLILTYGAGSSGAFGTEEVPLKIHYYLHILLPPLGWIILFAAAATFLKSKGVQSRFLALLLAAFAIEAGVVLLEVVENRTGLRVNPVALLAQSEIDVFGQTVKERIFGTIGNPNWVAGYFAVAVFPLAVWAYTLRRNLPRLMVFAILAVGMFGLASARSKGAFLALLVGAVHFAVMAYLTRTKQPSPETIQVRRRPRAAAAVLLVAALAGGFYYAARTPTGDSGGYIDHWAETLALRGDSITVRALLAHCGFQMWKGSPWTGLGPGEFKTSFVDSLRKLVEGPEGEKYQTRVARLHSLRATHVHNEYLQTLIEFGVIGLVFIELFFVWCQCRAFSIVRGSNDSGGGYLRLGFLSGVWAGFGGSLFDYPFHRPSQSFLLAVFLGAAIALPRGGMREAGLPGTPKRVLAGLIAVVFLVLGLAMLWQSQAKYVAQRLGFWGRTTLELPGGDRSRAFDALVRAQGLAPGEGEYTLLIAYYHLVARGDPNLAIRNIRRARETSDNPNRIFLEATAQLERNDLANAAQLIRFVEVLEPNRVGIEFLKGRLLQVQADWEGACRAFLREIQNARRNPDQRNPHLEQAHLRLANILEKEIGQYEEAAKHYEEFLRLLGPRTPTYPEAQIRLGDLSKNRFHDLDRAERYYLQALEILRKNGSTQEAGEVEKVLQEIQNRRERFR